MKILILSEEYPPYNTKGGAGVYIEELTANLAKNRKNKIEVCYFGNYTGKCRNIKLTGFPDFKNTKKFLRTKKFLTVANALTLNSLFVKHYKKSYDIIHANTWYTIFAGFLLKTIYNVPLVTTIHSIESLRPWKKQKLGESYEVSKWMEKIGVEASDIVISVSNDMKKTIEKSYNINPKNLKIIHHGINTNIYKPADILETKKILKKYKINTKAPYIVFLGRISTQKGILHLLNSVPFIKKEISLILLAGPADSEEIYNKVMLQYLKMKKRRKNIYMINKKFNTKEKIAILSGALALVTPSIFEPFGFMNLEAMACGIPVVSTDAGGIPEIVKDRESGFLVNINPDSDEQAPKRPILFAKNIAEKINILYSDSNLQKKMGKKALVHACKFSWQNTVEKTEKIYRLAVKKFKKNK